MFRHAISSVRTAVVRSQVARFSVSAAARGGNGELPIPGYRTPGEVATNWELAAGNERYEYLKKLAGEEPWEDFKPIYLSAPGTKKNPIILRGSDPERYVGCTGFPADSHETVWLTVRPHRGVDRCPHCGMFWSQLIVAPRSVKMAAAASYQFEWIYINFLRRTTWNG
ncbi:Cytochrome c oxidase subunit 4 [Phlyctochytrium planicorne]|nr:Cytochrome c oxidase subunit 4 [Phlyctochytrium planicorne]